MGWIGESVDSIKSLQIRQVLTQAVSLGQFSLFFTLKSFNFQLLHSNSFLSLFFRVYHQRISHTVTLPDYIQIDYANHVGSFISFLYPTTSICLCLRHGDREVEHATQAGADIHEEVQTATEQQDTGVLAENKPKRRIAKPTYLRDYI